MLAAILLVGTNAFAEAVEIDGIWYNLVSKAKVAEVTKNPNKYTGTVNIPEKVTYNGVDYDVTSIGGAAFQNSNVTSITIPNSVTYIGWGAFSGCSGLKLITIPNSVTKIDGYAFDYCNGLTFITIPNSVTSIGQFAFHGCTSLTTITISNNVTYLGQSAFAYCDALTSIAIECSPINIHPNAFANCPNLTDVYCNAENPISSELFQGSYIDYATLHVPASFVETYRTTEPWSNFGTIAPIYDEESSKPFPAGTYAKADLKRTFAEGWNTICLPFAIDNIEAAFGTGAKAYAFDDFADGELKFSQVTSLAAGTPYVIYVPAEITELIAFENIVVEESNTTSSNIDKNGACFRGTYAPVAAGEWTKNNSTDNIYGLTPDGRIRKAGPEASILGLRGYFDIPAGTEVKGFVFEDGATGIKTLFNSPLKGEAIYNLAGQRQNKAQKGINIVSGKKVLY